jgi:hypothetical protein
MKLYFDISALVKYFQREDGSYEVQALIDDEANQVWARSLALLELHSSLFRRLRNQELEIEFRHLNAVAVQPARSQCSAGDW